MTLTDKQFSVIYKTHNSKIYFYIKSKINSIEDARELTEDVLIKVFKFYHTFDESKSQFKTWMYNITNNILIDYFRKKKIQTVSINMFTSDGEDGTDSEYCLRGKNMVSDPNLNPLEALIQKDQLSKVMSKFNNLNTLETKLMTMYAVHGMSYNDIVNELNMPIGTVKGTIHRARTTMREAFPQLVNA